MGGKFMDIYKKAVSFAQAGQRRQSADFYLKAYTHPKAPSVYLYDIFHGYCSFFSADEMPMTDQGE
jgi:hypothetical protein